MRILLWVAVVGVLVVGLGVFRVFFYDQFRNGETGSAEAETAEDILVSTSTASTSTEPATVVATKEKPMAVSKPVSTTAVPARPPAIDAICSSIPESHLFYVYMYTNAAGAVGAYEAGELAMGSKRYYYDSAARFIDAMGTNEMRFTYGEYPARIKKITDFEASLEHFPVDMRYECVPGGVEADLVERGSEYALGIAWKEVEKHYPDYKRANGTLELVESRRVGTTKEWLFRFDVERALDASVEVIVNTQTGEIVSYQDSWS